MNKQTVYDNQKVVQKLDITRNESSAFTYFLNTVNKLHLV